MSTAATTTTETETSEIISWQKGRDDYGRSVHHLYRETGGWSAKGVVVRMPKAYIERHGADRTYMVNNWTLERDALHKITYHRTLAAAKAYLEGATN